MLLLQTWTALKFPKDNDALQLYLEIRFSISFFFSKLQTPLICLPRICLVCIVHVAYCFYSRRMIVYVCLNCSSVTDKNVCPFKNRKYSYVCKTPFVVLKGKMVLIKCTLIGSTKSAISVVAVCYKMKPEPVFVADNWRRYIHSR